MGLVHVDLEVLPAGGGAGELLLGAQTLETFGLGVDPLGRRLVPVDAYLASAK